MMNPQIIIPWAPSSSFGWLVWFPVNSHSRLIFHAQQLNITQTMLTSGEHCRVLSKEPGCLAAEDQHRAKGKINFEIIHSKDNSTVTLCFVDIKKGNCLLKVHLTKRKAKGLMQRAQCKNLKAGSKGETRSTDFCTVWKLTAAAHFGDRRTLENNGLSSWVGRLTTKTRNFYLNNIALMWLWGESV